MSALSRLRKGKAKTSTTSVDSTGAGEPGGGDGGGGTISRAAHHRRGDEMTSGSGPPDAIYSTWQGCHQQVFQQPLPHYGGGGGMTMDQRLYRMNDANASYTSMQLDPCGVMVHPVVPPAAGPGTVVGVGMGGAAEPGLDPGYVWSDTPPFNDMMVRDVAGMEGMSMSPQWTLDGFGNSMVDAKYLSAGPYLPDPYVTNVAEDLATFYARSNAVVVPGPEPPLTPMVTPMVVSPVMHQAPFEAPPIQPSSATSSVTNLALVAPFLFVSPTSPELDESSVIQPSRTTPIPILPPSHSTASTPVESQDVEMRIVAPPIAPRNTPPAASTLAAVAPFLFAAPPPEQQQQQQQQQQPTQQQQPAPNWKFTISLESLSATLNRSTTTLVNKSTNALVNRSTSTLRRKPSSPPVPKSPPRSGSPGKNVETVPASSVVTQGKHPDTAAPSTTLP
ncbi:hypothetical protein HK104_005926, partial [Borealophlyctis nickersoniae]